MTCRGQLARVTEAVASLPNDVRDDIVFVGLSMETGLDPAALQKYDEANGFPFIYAVMPKEYQQAVVDQFGREALIPPFMPRFSIASNGEVSQLLTGKQEPDEIAKELTALVKGDS
jgi:hypothetical protein